jgi:tetratricopeptide (TPR) repeat protein
VWTDAIRKLPGDPRSVGRWFPYLNRGSAYVDRNDFKSAMKDFEASSKLGDMGMGIFNAGSVLAASGRHAQALAAFDNAQREGYALYNLSFQRGLSLAALGRNAEAFNQFELTRSMNPPSPTREILQLNLARVALPLGRPDEAIKNLEPLLRTDPAHKEGKYLLGMAYITRGEPARALEVLDKLVAQDPNARSYYARALANFGVKRKAEALSDIDNALRLGGANPHLLEWRGKILALP